MLFYLRQEVYINLNVLVVFLLIPDCSKILYSNENQNLNGQLAVVNIN